MMELLAPGNTKLQLDWQTHAIELIDLEGKKVRIIDDDLIDLVAMSQVLSSFGINTTVAQSAERAYELIREIDQPDLILSDFRLSEQTNGIELIRNLRKLTGLSALPGLIVTGETSPDKLSYIESTQIPCLHKPVNMDDLIKTMQKLFSDNA